METEPDRIWTRLESDVTRKRCGSTPSVSAMESEPMRHRTRFESGVYSLSMGIKTSTFRHVPRAVHRDHGPDSIWGETAPWWCGSR